MGRAHTHLAACAIAVGLLLVGAHCAVAIADTPDSAGSQDTKASDSSNDPAPSPRRTEVKTNDDAKSADSQPAQSVQTAGISATESESQERTGEASQKKPVDKDSCAGNHTGKTTSAAPTPEAPALAKVATVPETVAPALDAPPLDLPPVPSSPVDGDTVDAATGETGAHHSHDHELPVMTLPFLPVPSTPPQVLGASVAPRTTSAAEVVTATQAGASEPSHVLLRASPGDLLPEPAPTGLIARGQAPKDYSYGYASRSLAGMAAGAMPGIAGIVFMTASGICLGYRQAKAQLAMIESAERFLI